MKKWQPQTTVGCHRLQCWQVAMVAKYLLCKFWRPFWMTPKDSPWFPQLNHLSFKSRSTAYGLHQRKHHARCPVQSASVMLQAPVQLIQALQQQLQALQQQLQALQPQSPARLEEWRNLNMLVFFGGEVTFWECLEQYTLLAASLWDSQFLKLNT